MNYTPTESMVLIQADNYEVMRITKDGIWVNPEMSVNDAAKKVLEALETNIKYLCERERKNALEEAAVEAMKDFDTDCNCDVCRQCERIAAAIRRMK